LTLSAASLCKVLAAFEKFELVAAVEARVAAGASFTSTMIPNIPCIYWRVCEKRESQSEPSRTERAVEIRQRSIPQQRGESMSEKAFAKIMHGLSEVKNYIDGEREGYKVTVPSEVDVKSIRKGLNMTQSTFSESFGFSLDAVKHWEGGRRTPEIPARAYLTVIQRNPSAVLEALRQPPESTSRIRGVSPKKRTRTAA